jgi:hypothetical protein
VHVQVHDASSASSSGRCPVVLDGSLGRSAHALDRHRRFRSTYASVPVSGAVPCDHEIRPGESRSESSVCWICERTMLHSIGESWSAIVPIMVQILEGKTTMVIKSRNFNSSTLISCKAATQIIQEAIVAKKEVRVQCAFAWGQTRLELTEIDSSSVIMVQSSHVSSIVARAGGSEFRIESMSLA